MSPDHCTVELETVREEELKDIVQRRKCYGLCPEEGAEATSRISSDLVGLSLSGGGIRSACFSLGVLQALHKKGLLKFIDYFSTISGGTYIATYLSSLALSRQEPFRADDSPLRVENEGNKQPAAVLRFIHGARYLRRPWLLLNKYLIGLFFINLAVFSAMVAVCALVAWLWRCADHPAVRDRASLLELDYDVYAPFWPFLLFLAAWLVAWMISYWKQGAEAPGRFAQFFLYLMVASLLIGFAILVGNGDTSAGIVPQSVVSFVEESQLQLRTIVFVAVAVMLIPLMRPWRLIQSGTQPKHWWERWIFAAASIGLLVGLPLVLIGYIGKENISGYGTHRDPDLLRQDIRDWPGLCKWIAAHQAYPGGNLPDGTPLRGRWLHLVPGSQQDVAKAAEGADESPVQDNIEALKVSVRLRFDDADYRGRYLKAFEVSGRRRDSRNALLEDHREYLARIQAAIAKETGRRNAGEPVPPELRNGAPQFALVMNAARLDGVLAECREKWLDIRGRSGWKQWKREGYGRRLFAFVGWLAGQKTVVAEYWDLKLKAEKLEDEICRILNRHVLPNPNLYQALAFAQGQDLKTKIDVITDVVTEKSDPNSEDALKEGQQLAALWQQFALTRAEGWPTYQIKALNRLLLEAHYAPMIEERTTIYRRVVLEEDQKTRLTWFFWAAALFFGAGIWVDLNATCLHRFYRDRLAQAFIVRDARSEKRIALSALDTTSRGAPYHLIMATVNMFRKRLNVGRDDDAELAGPDHQQDLRWTDAFLFSRRYCGSELTGYAPTRIYESYSRNSISLADAMAVSGAAVSPGRLDNWLFVFLMFVLNLRLGQWLPNPRAGRPRWQPRILPLLASLWRKAEDRSHCLVSDGGHSENLGILPLLTRRCALIVACDAGHDPDFVFRDLANVIRIARIHDGIQFLDLKEDRPFDTDVFRPDKRKDFSRRHHLLIRIRYPEEEGRPDGLLVYLKTSLTGDESVDLIQYRKESSGFPHESTYEQIYSDVQVESYRELGFHTILPLCTALPPDLWDRRNVDARQLAEWFRQADRRMDAADLSQSLAGPGREMPSEIDQQAARYLRDLKRREPATGQTEPERAARCEEAAAGLARSGPHAVQAAEVLIGALDDRDEWVRRAARRALEAIGPAAAPALAEALADTS